jgi:hypothetical protein
VGGREGGRRGASGSSDSEQLAFASARFTVAAVTYVTGNEISYLLAVNVFRVQSRVESRELCDTMSKCFDT